MSINRKDGSYVKQQRLLAISKETARRITGKASFYDELLVWIQFELGLSENRAKEYLDLVVKAKMWIVQGGLIVDQ